MARATRIEKAAVGVPASRPQRQKSGQMRLPASLLVCAASLIASCTQPSTGDEGASGSTREQESARLRQLLPDQSDLTQEIVSDGTVSRAEQEAAIDALFQCYTDSGLLPSDPEWDGARYFWTIDLQTSDDTLSDQRSALMFSCEETHWDFISSSITVANAPSDEEQGRIDAEIASCIDEAGLNGGGYLEGDPAVLGTPEAAKCYADVTGAG